MGKLLKVQQWFSIVLGTGNHINAIPGEDQRRWWLRSSLKLGPELRGREPGWRT
jgi:hypothetical protein